jgi:putative ATP-dependent endonuclease of OLD family
MRIVRLRIDGFRGVKRADIRFGATSVLFGSNNVGKTTIIEALALALGREGMVRSLTEHDFYGSNPQRADRIRIIAAIGGFTHNDPSRLPDWFSVKKGVPKWFDPTTGSESAIQKPAPFELVCEIGFQARFDHDNLEVETCRYFYDDKTVDDIFVDEAVTSVSVTLVRDIGFFLVSASRSWDRMISFGSELFRRVVSSESGMPAETIVRTRDDLRRPDFPLEYDAKLNPIINEVNREISSLFGHGNDLRLRLTSTDSAGVLEAVTPHFGSVGAPLIPARRQGSGLLSLQSLFLLLHFGQRRIAMGKSFCLALEEPELHLPPNRQRRVLRRLKALTSQIIVSTHSPLVASFADPTELLIVRNSDGVLTARPILERPLDAATPNAIRTLFQLKRVELVAALMSDVVVVPEGTYDFEWLSILSRVAELQPGADAAGILFSAIVGVVPTHNGAIVDTVEKLTSCHSRVVGLVDGDAAGQEYVRKLVSNGSQLVLRWPDGWTIEHVIGWILEPEKIAVLQVLGAELANAPNSIADLVARLKSDDVKDPQHLKGDRIAYETIGRTIGEHPNCLRRATELLDALGQAAKGDATPRFIKAATGNVFVFKP